MKVAHILLVSIPLLSGCQSAPAKPTGDSAIRRVDNCVCYRSAEGQQLQPWELAWKEPEKLREQFSHCICQAYTDLKSVENPARYVVPGTEIK